VAALALTDDQKMRIGDVRHETEVTMRELRLNLKSQQLERSAYEYGVHRGLVAADGGADSVLTAGQRLLVEHWRGRPIGFGRMHLRLVLRPNPSLAANER
jgi:hypothetical protein